MAKNGSLTTGSYIRNGTEYALVFSWSEVSQSVSNKTTTISWALTCSKVGDGPSLETGPVRLAVDNVEWYYFATHEGSDSSYEDEGENTGDRIMHRDGTKIASGTRTFTHNADGTKSFSVDLKGTCYIHDNNLEQPNMVGSKTFTLDPLPTNYTVTYNANGGSKAPASQTKNHGVDLVLSSSLPTGVTYYLYFNKNTTSSIEVDGDIYPDCTMPGTLSGKCTFSHWNTKSDGTGTSYDPGDTLSVNSNVTLYAIWEYPKIKLPPGYPERQDGVNCLGWSTDKNSATAPLTAGMDVTIKLNTTLYAIWKEPVHTVTFELNGGKYSGNLSLLTQKVAHGGSATLPTPDPTKEGKKFQGWLGNYLNVQSDSTVYAMWDTHPIFVMTEDGWQRMS